MLNMLIEDEKRKEKKLGVTPSNPIGIGTTLMV